MELGIPIFVPFGDNEKSDLIEYFNNFNFPTVINFELFDEINICNGKITLYYNLFYLSDILLYFFFNLFISYIMNIKDTKAAA